MPKPGEFPKDGDPAPDDTPLDPNAQIDPNEEQEEEEAPPEDPLKALQKQLDDQKRAHADEMAALRRQIPPAQPKPTPEAPKDETDWDNLIFSKPKEAVEKIIATTTAKVQREMREEYQRDQGTQKFWNSFYAKHQEFKRDQDHDLIELTLNSNLSSLANIPVTEALDKLADLTRDRILRYAGGKPRSKKAVVEGAEPPTARAAPKATDKRPASLSDVISKRKDARRTKRTVAA